MTDQPPAAAARSRRSALGLLGAGALATGVTLTAAGTGHADTTARTGQGQFPRDVRPGGAYDRYIAEQAGKDQFSGTLLVAHRGRPVLSRSYGMANRERAIPNQRDTIFALASASKPFTGLAVVQLAQQGKVRFHETLGAYLDGFPAEIANTVTAHQLLTHTSGMGDFQLHPYFKENVESWTSEAEMMAGIMTTIRQSPLEFTPGTKPAYSSSGIATLGAIVARVSGQSYYDYVRKHIFAAAGMTSTDFYTTPRWLTDRQIAQPYWRDSSGQRFNGLKHPNPEFDDWQMFVGNPAGNAFSTAPDLVRFARALQGGKLLNPAHTQLFVNGKVPNPPGPNPDPAVQHSMWAYGLFDTIYNNQHLISHAGSITLGGTTNWTIYLDTDWTGIALCNYFEIDMVSIIRQERQAVAGPSS